MQEYWQLKVGWDDFIPQELGSKWDSFVRQINDMIELRVDRHILLSNSTRIEIHGFCDASKHGYGACIYVRSIDSSNNILVRLACSKSRVAPLKAITIPRLESSGALILARLYTTMRLAIALPIKRCVFWSDSTNVLQWLKKSPQVLSTFESNRVREIQAVKGNIEWRHVRTGDNPADSLSRRQTPSEFCQNSIWFSGPSWLSKPEEFWPTITYSHSVDLPGMRKNICFLSKPAPCDIFLRISSYQTLINVIAFCLRMRPANAFKGKTLNLIERSETERRIIRLIQGEQFGTKVASLRKSNTIKGSKLAAFNLFLDQNGLLRVGRRLRNSEISEEQKNPILLPSYHHVTDLIIKEVHQRTFHAGIQTTLFTIRQRFWLLDGKNQVRKIVRQCVTCIRHRPVIVQYKMASLPESRVRVIALFAHTGIDFFGSIYIKEKKFRNRSKVKAYGCVFMCMASKAVHIEITSELTTAGFLAALRCFIGRRAIPAHVYSDNRKNFVGARNQLRELDELFNSDQFHNTVDSFAVQKNINWRFNPPEFPHFGGIWEAAVKSSKHHLKRVIGERLLTYEEINTLVIEIEAVLNSRPLCSISTDPNDLVALTPAHVLVGRPLIVLPEDDLLPIPENRLSVWRFISRVRQDFWRRWQIEYLSELQKRQNWHANEGEIKEGTVVILIDKNQPYMRWELDIVQAVCPGNDGINRVAIVKTPRGTLMRNTRVLCLLPVNS